MEETYAVTQNVGKQLLAEDVFQHLGNAIADGTFAPGERLRDADLAAQYNVSRTPVREALQRLERIGLVEMAPSRFTRVTEPTAEEIEQAREYAGYQAGVLCAMAMPRLSPGDRDRARALVDAARTAPEVPLHRSRANWALFEHLSEASGNSVHRTLTAEPKMALLRLLRLWTPTDRQLQLARTARDDLTYAIDTADVQRGAQAGPAVFGVVCSASGRFPTGDPPAQGRVGVFPRVVGREEHVVQGTVDAFNGHRATELECGLGDVVDDKHTVGAGQLG